MSQPKEIEAFLREARTWDEPPDEKGAALRELVERRIATAPAATGARSFAARIAAPVGLAALALLAGVVLTSRDVEAPPTAEDSAVAPLAPRTSEERKADERPAPEPAVDVRALPDAPTARTLAKAIKPPIDTSLEIETKILREARAARLAGSGERSLALVEEHASRFPNGALAPERDAERIDTLCAIGRVGEARKRFAEFERSGAPAVLLGRARVSCGGVR